MISYEMVADINVLCSCMLNQIVGELDCTLIVTKAVALLELDSKVIQGGLHPKYYAQQLSADMYSASTVDNATLFCFFDYHETSNLSNN
jgi:hypothetical protein